MVTVWPLSSSYISCILYLMVDTTTTAKTTETRHDAAVSSGRWLHAPVGRSAQECADTLKNKKKKRKLLLVCSPVSRFVFLSFRAQRLFTSHFTCKSGCIVYSVHFTYIYLHRHMHHMHVKTILVTVETILRRLMQVKTGQERDRKKNSWKTK